MNNQRSILIVHDDAGFAESVSGSFQARGFSTNIAGGCVGRNSAADVIKPTSLSAAGVDAHLRLAAENAVPGEGQAARRALAMVVRAYDPCISCCVHLVRGRRET